MSKTNFRNYKWLIDTLSEYQDKQWGPTVKDILQFYQESAKEIGAVYVKNNIIYGNSRIIRETLSYWRARILALYGIFIGKDRDSRHYKIKNPELLDENKTIRFIIDKLADDEAKGFPEPSLKEYNNPYLPNLTALISTNTPLQFINSQFGYEEESDMVSIIRFCMTIGERMVIKLNKVAPEISKDKKYLFEPQYLKDINDRWYVIGGIDEYPPKRDKKFIILDVANIIICDDDDFELQPDDANSVNENLITTESDEGNNKNILSYTLSQGFDITKLIDPFLTFDSNKVVSLFLKTFAGFFDEKPFCATQEKVEMDVLFHSFDYNDVDSRVMGDLFSTYKIYVKLDSNFFIQYLAYGDEVCVVNRPEYSPESPTDITEDEVAQLQEIKEKSSFLRL